jgi:hypothetical protein
MARTDFLGAFLPIWTGRALDFFIPGASRRALRWSASFWPI